MADTEGKDKPNLKICIDNTESDIDTEESLSLSETSDTENEVSETEVKSNQVEFNVRIGKTHPPVAKKPTLATTTPLTTKKSSGTGSSFDVFPKRYENKAGEFITGLDLTDKEKCKERSRRFGIPSKARHMDYTALNESLGIKSGNLEPDVDERGIRTEAIHMRGLENMHTQDVFKYFQDYSPGSIEWIDDASCNVVWTDKANAARALMRLSRSENCVKKYIAKKQSKKSQTAKKLDEVKAQEDKSAKSTSSDSEVDDELDLTEDPGGKPKAESESAMDTSENQSNKSDKQTKSEKDKEDIETTTTSDNKEEDMEEGEVSSDSAPSDSESDHSIDELFRDVDLPKVSWPPGKWRLGVPCPKADRLFFRYATKADVKLPGAEKRSNYYIRHGNPNYGGMKGLISNSRKRQHWSRRQQQEEENAAGDRKPITTKIPRGRELPDYSDVAMFTGDVTIGEKEEFDRRSPVKRAPVVYDSEGEDEDCEEVEEMDEAAEESAGQDTTRPPLYTRGYARVKDSFSLVSDDLGQPAEGADSGQEENVSTAELELQKLLAFPRRSGRMYADDVEEEIKAKMCKRSDDHDLTVVTDVSDWRQEEATHRGLDPVTDARHRITGKGVDLRSRLKQKRHAVSRKRHTETPLSADHTFESPKYQSLQIEVTD